MKKRLTISSNRLPLVALLGLLCGAPMSLRAQAVAELSPWYGGVQGGVPFGVSTFSSFGADKTRAGYTAGIYGGYRFNRVLSAEVSMKWGTTTLAEQDCCIGKGYWLGADGNRYNIPVIGLTGWNYADLKSRVSLQQYGAQLNVNLLGLFEGTRQSRWTLDVSPLLAAVGTRATLRTISDNKTVSHGSTNWHLGAGGNLQGGYQITENLRATLYSGVTYLTGKRMDGMPKYRHKNNYIWESGVRIGWRFGACNKRGASQATSSTTSLQHAEAVLPVTPESTAQAAPIATQSPERQPAPVVASSESSPEVTVQPDTATNNQEALTFPTLYFDFNRTTLSPTQTPQLQTMLETLRQHPDAKIIITGWCDTKGTKMVNDRYSLRRAETVKAWLTKNGIDATRITTCGAGSDFHQSDASKARRTDTIHNMK